MGHGGLSQRLATGTIVPTPLGRDAGAGDPDPTPCRGRGGCAAPTDLAFIPHMLGLLRVEAPPCTSAQLLRKPDRSLPRAEQGDYFSAPISCSRGPTPSP